MLKFLSLFVWTYSLYQMYFIIIINLIVTAKEDLNIKCFY